MRTLNFGCGNKYHEECVNVDINDEVYPDVVADLSQPLPFKDGSFEKVALSHVLEHFAKPLRVMEEVWRVCKDGALVYIVSPHPYSVWAWGDPDHKAVISPEWMGFVSWPIYDANWKIKSPMSQLRPACDFDVTEYRVVPVGDEIEGNVEYLLRAVKPIRKEWWEEERLRVLAERRRRRESKAAQPGQEQGLLHGEGP